MNDTKTHPAIGQDTRKRREGATCLGTLAGQFSSIRRIEAPKNLVALPAPLDGTLRLAVEYRAWPAEQLRAFVALGMSTNVVSANGLWLLRLSGSEAGHARRAELRATGSARHAVDALAQHLVRNPNWSRDKLVTDLGTLSSTCRQEMEAALAPWLLARLPARACAR